MVWRRGWPTKLIFVKRHSKRYTASFVFVENTVLFCVVTSRYIWSYFRSIRVSNETAAGSIPRILFHSISSQSKSRTIENASWTAILLQHSIDFFSIQQSLSFCYKKAQASSWRFFFFWISLCGSTDVDVENTTNCTVFQTFTRENHLIPEWGVDNFHKYACDVAWARINLINRSHHGGIIRCSISINPKI